MQGVLKKNNKCVLLIYQCSVCTLCELGKSELKWLRVIFPGLILRL